MDAILLNQFGSVTELQSARVDRPTLKPKQILVANHAVALDPYDVKFVMGLMGEADRLPLIPGSSVAGEVVAVGAAVTDFQIGDRVAASRHHQTYAEFVPVGQSALAKIPDNLSDATAAASVLGAATGYQMITRDLDIQAGEKILIQGGTGSVGTTAIQVALMRGADVYTTANDRNSAFLEQFGPVHCIDYKTAYEQTLSGFDAVLDSIGGETALKSAKILNPGGRLRNLSNDAQLEDLSHRYQIDAQHSFATGKGDLLQELFTLIAQGTIKIPIAEVLPFSQNNLQQAHHALRQSSPLGKIVLEQ